MMQAMLRLHAEDKLVGPQRHWFQSTRPAEELYDVKRDPYQINNIAQNKQYQDILADMRAKLEKWRMETGDMGDIAEEEMVASWWPDGKQPKTHTPQFVINAGQKRNMTIGDKGGTYNGPVQIKLYCPTQGASIGYRYDRNTDNWILYTGPIQLDSGEFNISAKAIRYGYEESDVLRSKFIVVDNLE
jgi:hypothetical protein